MGADLRGPSRYEVYAACDSDPRRGFFVHMQAGDEETRRHGMYSVLTQLFYAEDRVMLGPSEYKRAVDVAERERQDGGHPLHLAFGRAAGTDVGKGLRSGGAGFVVLEELCRSWRQGSSCGVGSGTSL